jgi:MFS family permease
MNQYRDYHLLFLSYAFALFGTGVAVVGLALLAFQLAGDYAGAVLGTALAIKTAAYIAVAPVAAVLAGRICKRHLLIGLNLLRAAAILALPLASSVWQTYLLIFVFAAASAVFIPTYQAIVPHLLPEPKAYSRALVKARIATELENVASPLAAAALLLLFDHDGLFLVAVAIFLLSAICLTNASIPEMRSISGAQIWSEVRRGARLFVEHPDLRFLVPLNLAVALAIALVMVNTVVLVQGLLGLGERETAVALAVFGVGVLIGAIAILPLLSRCGIRRTMLAGSVLTILGLVGGTQIGSFGGLLALWAVLGLGSGLALTPASIVLRQHLQTEDRALLYATYFSLTNVSLLLAYPMAGWIGATMGQMAGFMLLALGAGVAVLAALRLGRSAGPGAQQKI